jgi:hypothetical protein
VEAISRNYRVQVAHLKEDRDSFYEDRPRTKSGGSTGPSGSSWTYVDGGSSIVPRSSASVMTVG